MRLFGAVRGWHAVVLAAVLVGVLVSASCRLLPGHQTASAAPPVVAITDPAWRPQLSIVERETLARDFDRLKETMAGQVGLAIMPVGGGRMTVLGDWTTGIAWSTIKVPLAIAALRHDPEGSYDDAEAAITWSDNGAAESLWVSLGDGMEAAKAVQDVLDETGDGDTGVVGPRTQLDYTAFGQTEWTLSNQARFGAALPCLPETETVTRLMSQITPEQRWGLGTLAGAEFKGGWGPDDDSGIYLARQFGVVPTGAGHVGVALAAQADSGTFEDATALLDQLGALLARHLDELPGGACRSDLTGAWARQPGFTKPDS